MLFSSALQLCSFSLKRPPLSFACCTKAGHKALQFHVSSTLALGAPDWSSSACACLQTIAGASTEYMMGSAEISFVNVGPVTSNLTSISVNPNGTADVTAQVAVDFVAPEGTQVSAEP